MKYFFIVFLFVIKVIASPVECEMDFAKIWNLYENGKMDQSFLMAKECQYKLEVLSNWYLLLKAKVAFDRENWAECKEYVDKVKNDLLNAYNNSFGNEQDGTKFMYLYMLKIGGISNFELSNYNDAITCLAKYVKIVPDDIGFRLYLASAYSKNKQYKKALNEMQIIYKQDSSAENAYYLAVAYMDINYFEKALFYIKQAVETDTTYRLIIKEDKNFQKLKNNQQFMNIVEDSEAQ